MAKKFMFVCFGILALAGAYAIGASNSVAQVGGDTLVGIFPMDSSAEPGVAVFTSNGDIWARTGVPSNFGGTIHWNRTGTWTSLGNVFTGTVSNQGTSLGGVKGLFR